MKTFLTYVAALLLVLGTSAIGQASGSKTSSGLSFGSSTPEEILDGAYQEIMHYDELGLDVPEDVYNFYFACERLVHPEFYEGRHEQAGALDQLDDTCPGTIIQGPGDPVGVGGGSFASYINYGQTTTASNNCTYPNCRLGRDVVAELIVHEFGYIVITTTGSAFDTYLCIYQGACCGEEGSKKIAENNNNPDLCEGQRLAAGISDCFSPGTYWIVLDGAGPTARGSFALRVDFEPCD